MKEGKCFYYWQSGHITANYLKNIINAILVVEIISTPIDNNKILGKK